MYNIHTWPGVPLLTLDVPLLTPAVPLMILAGVQAQVSFYFSGGSPPLHLGTLLVVYLETEPPIANLVWGVVKQVPAAGVVLGVVKGVPLPLRPLPHSRLLPPGRLPQLHLAVLCHCLTWCLHTAGRS